MTIELDKLDRKILSTIQSSGKIPLQELADTCNSTSATVWRRLNLLEEKGIITGYQAVIDRRKLGYDICALVNLSFEKQVKNTVEVIEKKIMERPEVLECYATTGNSDFMLRIIAANIDDYYDFIQNFLFDLPGVSHVNSSLALKEIKQTLKVPI